MSCRVAILASGGGTTAEAFIRNSLTDALDQTVELVIVSKPTAGIIGRIKALNDEFGLSIPCVVISKASYPAEQGEHVEHGCQTQAEARAILEMLQTHNIDIVALLGYMKKVSPNIVHAYGWQPTYTQPEQARMVNSHPGPLPATKALYGQHVQQSILDLGLTHGTQTLHIVAEAYDEGPMLAEHNVPVQPEDTAETLFARIQVIEKQHIAHDIQAFWQQRTLYLKQQEDSNE